MAAMAAAAVMWSCESTTILTVFARYSLSPRQLQKLAKLERASVKPAATGNIFWSKCRLERSCTKSMKMDKKGNWSPT